MSICGSCGRSRERDEVCCEQQALNQGRIHGACTHPPPEMPAGWLPLYKQGQAETQAALAAQLPA